MTDQILELKYAGTSRLLSRLMLLCNKEFGWPIRTEHGELGVMYSEYRAHGATITLYGALISRAADTLDIHLRIHEFSGDMAAMTASLSRQIDDILQDPHILDNRYLIFEEKPHGSVPEDRKNSKKDHSSGKSDGPRVS
jgi:hypothetical protein